MSATEKTPAMTAIERAIDDANVRVEMAQHELAKANAVWTALMALRARAESAEEHARKSKPEGVA